MRETKINKMTEVRNVKALSWVLRERVTVDASLE